MNLKMATEQTTKKNPVGLELVISFFEGHSRFTEGHLKLLAENWHQSKPIIRNLAKSNRTQTKSILHKLKEKYNLGFDETELGELYDELVDNWDCYDLSECTRFATEMGISLTEKQKNVFWQKFFSRTWDNHRLDSAVRSIGNPVITQQSLNSICNNWLQLTADRKPDQEKVKLEDLELLLTKTDLSPNWDMDLAKKACDTETRFLDNPYAEKTFELLAKIGVAPIEEKARAMYRDKLRKRVQYEHRKGEHAKETLESVSRILKVSRLSIEEEDRHLVEEFYKNSLDHAGIRYIREMEKLTNIPLTRELVNSVYLDFLKQGEIGHFNALLAECSIQPDFQEKDVQGIYKSLFERGELDNALKVYLLTDIDPVVDPKVVEQAFQLIDEKLALKNYRPSGIIEYQTLEWVHKFLPQQTASFCKKHLKDAIRKGNFYQADQLVWKGGYTPDPEDAYVLACRSGNYEKAKTLFEDHGDAITKVYPEYASLAQFIK